MEDVQVSQSTAMIVGALVTVAYIALIWLIAQIAGFNNRPGQCDAGSENCECHNPTRPLKENGHA